MANYRVSLVITVTRQGFLVSCYTYTLSLNEFSLQPLGKVLLLLLLQSYYHHTCLYSFCHTLFLEIYLIYVSTTTIVLSSCETFQKLLVTFWLNIVFTINIFKRIPFGCMNGKHWRNIYLICSGDLLLLKNIRHLCIHMLTILWIKSQFRHKNQYTRLIFVKNSKLFLCLS